MKKILAVVVACLLLPALALATETVDINTASLQQLDRLTGIGLALAKRIAEARPFVSVDDLLRVKGIGPATLQKIKDQGLAYVEATGVRKTISPLPKEKESSNTVNIDIIAASEPLQKNTPQSPRFSFFIALVITIVAGTITILLKIYFHHVRS